MNDAIRTAIASAPVQQLRGIKLSVPELFAEPAFQHYVNSTQVMTWHDRQGPIDPDDLADVTVFVDPSLTGEGTDSEMPGWDLIVEKVRAIFGPGPSSGNHFVVVLSNN